MADDERVISENENSLSEPTDSSHDYPAAHKKLNFHPLFLFITILRPQDDEWSAQCHDAVWFMASTHYGECRSDGLIAPLERA